VREPLIKSVEDLLQSSNFPSQLHADEKRGKLRLAALFSTEWRRPVMTGGCNWKGMPSE
jgi:hypothetical protein